MKTQNEQIESRVTELEKNLQAKDAQIVDLQYQVKDLSSKIDAIKPAESEQVSTSSQVPRPKSGLLKFRKYLIVHRSSVSRSVLKKYKGPSNLPAFIPALWMVR